MVATRTGGEGGGGDLWATGGMGLGGGGVDVTQAVLPLSQKLIASLKKLPDQFTLVDDTIKDLKECLANTTDALAAPLKKAGGYVSAFLGRSPASHTG